MCRNLLEAVFATIQNEMGSPAVGGISLEHQFNLKANQTPVGQNNILIEMNEPSMEATAVLSARKQLTHSRKDTSLKLSKISLTTRVPSSAYKGNLPDPLPLFLSPPSSKLSPRSSDLRADEFLAASNQLKILDYFKAVILRENALELAYRS
ncbi:hypothetical protein O6H91_19G063500 [Diphasiastrum complanatum]|uniref:Uncharacterized protein n=1 Tax=Diphasiastrum complanatum TaxID=34168 RepID=A0ACC2AVY4_DIPCM|nr:hypothetical protein O6H91_19G063500 [Diphasiastrum complanatum]